MKLHIDIETYSDVDIKRTGVYPYTESGAFEIMLVAYAVNDGPVEAYAWDDLPDRFFELLRDPKVRKYAHNAAFERICFRAAGYDIPATQWRCTAVWSAYAGLPMSLAGVSSALNLTQGKLDTGTLLINYFAKPCKPTKTNGSRTRNLPGHNPEKWQSYVEYCVRDVEAEREIESLLRAKFPFPEWTMYALDQDINDRGVRVDQELAAAAVRMDQANAGRLKDRMRALTGLENPGSLPQLKGWIKRKTGIDVPALNKETLPALQKQIQDPEVRELLDLRAEASKTSTKKYTAALDALCADGRIRGLFQMYGAGRTGRWAGRFMQLQNMPGNRIDLSLDNARKMVVNGDTDGVEFVFGSVSDLLSQLIRTALLPTEGFSFAPSDFSAIEARVIAWLAGEKWRLDVFKTHGRIYEASASRMFNVPEELITKGSSYRKKGKIGELALGFQGGVNALINMGADKMGLTEPEMQDIVKLWRLASPHIVKLWYAFERLAKEAIENPNMSCTHTRTGIVFKANSEAMTIKLPSGRSLVYRNARLIPDKRFGNKKIVYKGVDGTTKQWTVLDTYGGKLTENIVQAVAADLLRFSIVNLIDAGYPVVMHVHDEVVLEVQDNDGKEDQLRNIERIMAMAPVWAKGLPLSAEGFLCNYYKKDI